MRVMIAILCLLATPVTAETARASGGVLRWLDKLSGDTEDLVLQTGEAVDRGPLTIMLDECRYPANDPASNAFVHLTIMDNRAKAPAFNGWMIASSPALSAMDHARYDVWVLSCDVPEADAPAVDANTSEGE
jgi:hypothetical protein